MSRTRLHTGTLRSIVYRTVVLSSTDPLGITTTLHRHRSRREYQSSYSLDPSYIIHPLILISIPSQ